MIEPTVGRIVHFYDNNRGPMAAIICYVHSDVLINVSAFTSAGIMQANENVQLVQDESSPIGARYCTWMAYQKGQAEKTEELQRKLDAPII